jgi:hypothetical protein
MNIHTLRDNLKRTIAGKEAMLNTLIQRKDVERELHDEFAYFATKEFLTINIDELRRILADVEVCCEQAVADSWRGEDRQGGA